MTLLARLLLAAMLLQGGMTLVLLWVLGTRRVPLVTKGKIAVEDIALSKDPWPDRAKQASNAFDNQFQLPVLFFFGCAGALYFGPNWVEVVLAVIFVVSRLIHAYVFVTSNDVVRRFSAYVVGYGVLILFWLDLVVRLIFSFIAST